MKFRYPIIIDVDWYGIVEFNVQLETVLFWRRMLLVESAS